MEGRSNLRDESALHERERFQESRGKKGYAFDNDFSLLECGFDECKNRLRGLFNQLLVKFLEGRGVNKCIKPLPALFANGKPVDLFKLFWVVRKLGGHNSISRENLWDFVAEECGLGFGVTASVKLIYTEYLYELDHWLWHGLKTERKFSDDGDRVVENLEDLLQDVMKEFGDFGDGKWKKGTGNVKLVSSDIGKCGNGTDITKRLEHCSSNKGMNEAYDHQEESAKQVGGFSEGGHGDDDGKTCPQNGNGGVELTKKVIEEADVRLSAGDKIEELFPQVSSGRIMLSSNNGVNKAIESRKRKRQHLLLSKMLRWVKNVAKQTGDVAIGRIPDYSKWKDHCQEELWFQVLLTREALFIRKRVNSPGESSLQQYQKKPKMHPNMYEEDALNHQSIERSRCSQRAPLVKSHFCSCCNSTSQKMGAFGGTVGESLLDEPAEKEVSIGPLFQAEVPKWSGRASESDSKWLGIRVWPPPAENVEDKRAMECDPIGKGRPNTCGCSFPGHTECVRFHIAEKRLKLNRELGAAFYKWRFDRMGEEVCLSWTMEEEERFKEMIKLKNEFIGKFWRNAFKLFPSRTRQELISYYYNVCLVRRRSYQNRVTPKEVDSDDDEKEIGSVGANFGYRAIYVPDLRLPICIENKQCLELE